MHENYQPYGIRFEVEKLWSVNDTNIHKPQTIIEIIGEYISQK